MGNRLVDLRTPAALNFQTCTPRLQWNRPLMALGSVDNWCSPSERSSFTHIIYIYIYIIFISDIYVQQRYRPLSTCKNMFLHRYKRKRHICKVVKLVLYLRYPGVPLWLTAVIYTRKSVDSHGFVISVGASLPARAVNLRATTGWQKKTAAHPGTHSLINRLTRRPGRVVIFCDCILMLVRWGGVGWGGANNVPWHLHTNMMLR